MTVIIGKLRHRVTIEQSTEARGADGDVTETWAPVATEWAEVKPDQSRMGGNREYVLAQTIQSGATGVIRIRYRSGITTKMRVTWGSRIFSILGLVNPGERNIELHLMVQEQT